VSEASHSLTSSLMCVEQLAAREEKEPNRTILFTGKLTITRTENSGKLLTIRFTPFHR
jgi:hypothetical protein